jgi:peptide/nickel transport system ATP-binding protein
MEPVTSPAKPLLKIDGLCVEFKTRDGVVKALDQVTLDVRPGEVVGVVGESGSGKSVLAYALTGLLDRAGKITAGSAVFDGRQLVGQTERMRRRYRGHAMALIFQSPRTSLNPIRPVGAQIADVLKRHQGLSGATAATRAVQLLADVRIPDPERRARAYPFELSGGTCQRVLIALALACQPAMMIADEPTTGLDVTTQAAIVDLLKDLAAARQMAVLFITHDLPLAVGVCDRIVVMHAGHVVESAPSLELFRDPHHPYTARLVGAVPASAQRLDQLRPIPGNLPDLRDPLLPPCRYAGRCERGLPACDQPLPLTTTGRDHQVACWNPL